MSRPGISEPGIQLSPAMSKPEASPAPKRGLLARHPLVSREQSASCALLGPRCSSPSRRSAGSRAEPPPQGSRADCQRGKTVLLAHHSSAHKPAPRAFSAQPSSLGKLKGQDFAPPSLRGTPSFCLHRDPRQGNSPLGRDSGFDRRGLPHRVPSRLQKSPVFQLLVCVALAPELSHLSELQVKRLCSRQTQAPANPSPARRSCSLPPPEEEEASGRKGKHCRGEPRPLPRHEHRSSPPGTDGAEQRDGARLRDDTRYLGASTGQARCAAGGKQEPHRQQHLKELLLAFEAAGQGVVGVSKPSPCCEKPQSSPIPIPRLAWVDALHNVPAGSPLPCRDHDAEPRHCPLCAHGGT